MPPPIQQIFQLDLLSWIMVSLLALLGSCVGGFSRRYMKGDSRYHKFFFDLVLLIISAAALFCADHIALFWGAWCLSHFFLVKLMIHKPSWSAAKQSGLVAAKSLGGGALFLGIGLVLMQTATGSWSISYLSKQSTESPSMFAGLVMFVLGVMIQSAIFPFHRWLVSSLNSPTPVSAMMHAGLVNGGGFLLLRFANLIVQEPLLLNGMFLFGILSTLFGTGWKLVQTDVKRMLAYSTVGQMGFMMAQCGLGLFPAALAHIVTHGIFKAHLFLATGSSAKEKRSDLSYKMDARTFVGSLICGFLGSLVFAVITKKSWLSKDTTLLLLIVSWIGASQVALPLLSYQKRSMTFLAMFSSLAMSLIYGSSVRLISHWVDPMNLMHPQSLNGLHFTAAFLLIFSWIGVLIYKHRKTKISRQLYVALLNSSQPNSKTITTNRNQYSYL